MEQFVTLLSCTDPSIAYIARSKLEHAGIPCLLANEHLIGITYLFSNALGGVEVKVPASELETARALLSEDAVLPEKDVDDECGGDPPGCKKSRAELPGVEDLNAPPPRAEDFLPETTCPACGSAELESKNYRRLSALLAYYCGIPLLLPFKRRYRCLACGHKWKLDVQ